MTREMKDSGVEWIGEIPKHWETKRLKVALLREKELVDKYNGENILSLTMNGVIVRDLVNPKGKMPITFDGYQKITKGNLITCLFDIDVTPRCVGVAFHDGLTSPAYTQYKVKKAFYTDFVYYYLLMLDNDKILVPITKSLRNTIKSEDFLNLEFSFPDFHLQKRISEHIKSSISKINHIISDTNQSIEELKKYKQALITEVVTKGLDKNVEMFESNIDWVGSTPKDWEVLRLKSLFKIVDERNKTDENAVLLSLFTALGVKPRSEMENKGNKAQTVINYKKVIKNDLVVNKLLAWMGAIGYSDYDGVTSPDYDVYRARANDKVDKRYYNYYFRDTDFKTDCYKYGRGIMMMRWRTYPEQFLNIRVLNPPLKIQEKIADYLDEKTKKIDKLIKSKTQLIKEFEQYKQSLIYEYITGKKEV